MIANSAALAHMWELSDVNLPKDATNWSPGRCGEAAILPHRRCDELTRHGRELRRYRPGPSQFPAAGFDTYQARWLVVHWPVQGDLVFDD